MRFDRWLKFTKPGRPTRILAGALVASLLAAGEAVAEPVQEPATAASSEERIQALEAKVQALAEELSAQRIAEAVPVDSEFDPVWGVGPSASKVYREGSGLSIGGYGEVRFRHDSTDDDIFDALRAVLYVGYKFSDSWVLNSEIEFEHGGGSDVFVEFLNLDYLHSDALNFRVGLILIPMGFVNQLHEPTFYYGASRPEVEKTIIPTTWRENGAGFFGRIGDRITYQVYGVSSFEGSQFNASGFRPGRQKGIKALTNDWSFVARADVAAMSGLNLGASVYYGNQGQGQSIGGVGVGSLSTAIYELHAEYKRYGITARGLFSQAFVENPDALNAGIRLSGKTGFLAESLIGGYVEVAYDVMPRLLPETKQSLEPFFRYERLNTQSSMQDAAAYAPTLKYNRHLYTVGLQYKPISQIVLKLDYRWITQQSNGQSLDKQIEFGAGYVF
ncbi:MAG TPA: hypothetical protein EYG06_00405 [Myxococcales bacterium]|nr:hypothetical protein [Myxococcales bacterium]